MLYVNLSEKIYISVIKQSILTFYTSHTHYEVVKKDLCGIVCCEGQENSEKREGSEYHNTCRDKQ